MIADIITLLGSLCFLIASIGLLRMPDSLARVHAATKASSLGVILLLVAAAIKFPTTGDILMAMLILILVLLTAPMAAQSIASRLIPPANRKAAPNKENEAKS